MSTSTALVGTGRLVRFVLRRDRVRIPLWLAAVAGLVVASAAGIKPIYPDQEAIQRYVDLFGDNPALIAFAGPGYGFDDPNLGVILVNETQIYGFIVMGLMSIFLVNRHTRAEEERERAELIRSNVVGRHAPGLAAGAVVAGLNLVIAVISAASFVALGYGVAGSFALATSYAAVGLMFAGFTAAIAQIVPSGRAVVGLAGGLLAATFIVRAVGDIGDSWVRWLSPMGWAQGVRAFADERWWLLAVCLVVAAAAFAAAVRLESLRDVGGGLVPPRLGRPGATGWRTHPFGLAFRLHRGAVIGWTIGLFCFGVLYGSVGDDIGEMLEDSPGLEDIFAQLEGGSIADSYFVTVMAMQAMLAAGFAISAALRPRTEEQAGRAEPLLAGPLSRWSWLGGHVALAVAGTIVGLAASGLGVGIGYAVVIDDAGQIPRLLGASLVTAPAVLVLLGWAVVLYGWVPQAALAAWAALAVTVVVGVLGDLLHLPAWSRWLSPLEHVPGLPVEQFDARPLIVLSLVAAVLVGAGLWAFRARDLDVR